MLPQPTGSRSNMPCSWRRHPIVVGVVAREWQQAEASIGCMDMQSDVESRRAEVGAVMWHKCSHVGWICRQSCSRGMDIYAVLLRMVPGMLTRRALAPMRGLCRAICCWIAHVFHAIPVDGAVGVCHRLPAGTKSKCWCWMHKVE